MISKILINLLNMETKESYEIATKLYTSYERKYKELAPEIQKDQLISEIQEWVVEALIEGEDGNNLNELFWYTYNAIENSHPISNDRETELLELYRDLLF